MTQPLAHIPPERLSAIQMDYLKNLSEVLGSETGAQKTAALDRRFAGGEWQKSSPFSMLAALYVLNSQTLMSMADALQADTKTRNKIKFLAQQWLDAASPSNFLATNPERNPLH